MDLDFREADTQHSLLRKILGRLKQLVTSASGSSTVVLEASDIQIGAIELKDASTDTRVKVTGGSPSLSDNGVVTRNIVSPITPSSPTTATAGTSSAQIIAANTNRRGLVIINTSTVNVSLAFGGPAVLLSGITLYPRDSFSMDEFSLNTSAVHAIASAAGGTLGIQEFSA